MGFNYDSDKCYICDDNFYGNPADRCHKCNYAGDNDKVLCPDCYEKMCKLYGKITTEHAGEKDEYCTNCTDCAEEPNTAELAHRLKLDKNLVEKISKKMQAKMKKLIKSEKYKKRDKKIDKLNKKIDELEKLRKNEKEALKQSMAKKYAKKYKIDKAKMTIIRQHEFYEYDSDSSDSSENSDDSE